MRTLILILFLFLAGSASAQQLTTAQNAKCPREAESILIASCRTVGEKLEIAMPDPRVELRIGDRINAVESYEGKHVIHMKQWNKALFKHAALHVCLRAAEDELVPVLATKVRDY
jgi:hypothetical protein